MSTLLVMLVKSYSVLPIVLQRIMNKDLFWHFLRSLLIMTYLITLNLEKGVLVLEKSLEKTWILDLKSVLTHQIVILTSEYLLPSLVGFSPFSYSFMLAKRSKKKNCNKEWHKHIWYVHICRCVTVNICRIRYGFMSAQELSSTDWTWPLRYVRVS